VITNCQALVEARGMEDSSGQASTESTSIGTSLGKVPVYSCLLDFAVF